MGPGSGKKKGKKKNHADHPPDGSFHAQRPALLQQQAGFLWVDPLRVRFQHSKIRPYFSGCGRSIQETLESIRNKELSPLDIPPIQVIVGPNNDDEGEQWYFSLNNRRLWVLKRCREEGLLEQTNNLIKVRVRTPKSSAEAARYSVENCALEAKIIKEIMPETNNNRNARGKQNHQKNKGQSDRGNSDKEKNQLSQEANVVVLDASKQRNPTGQQYLPINATDQEASSSTDNESDDDDDAIGFVSKNPFSALA